MSRMRLLNNIISKSANQVEGFCIAKNVQVKSNAKGSDYLDLILGDADGEINAKLWDYDPAVHGTYKADCVIKVRGTVSIFRDAEQLKIERIRNLHPDEDVDMSALVPCAPFDSEYMYSKVWDCTEKFKCEELKLLTQYFLTKHRDLLICYPAALKVHHAQRGGLLYHISTMLDAAQAICGVYGALYPSLNSELVFAGIILHDIAKMKELEVGSLGLARGYSAHGQLLGHITIGVSMVATAAVELGISEKTELLLEHILLSHHGEPDYGSPRYPMFPEAEIVRELDNLDAKLFTMFAAISGVNEEEFTERLWSLDNRQLYNHGNL